MKIDVVREKSVTRLQSLDSVRGCAALSVVFLHYFMLVDGSTRFGTGPTEFFYFSSKTPLNIFWAGRQAVLLFFILSGYVLTHMINQSKGNSPILCPRNYIAYAMRRWIRLWPVYFISLMISFLMLNNYRNIICFDLNNWTNGFFETKCNIFSFIKFSFFITSFKISQLNFPAWSLVQEMRASLAFPFMILLVNRFGVRRNLIGYWLLSFNSIIASHFLVLSKYSDFVDIVQFFHYILFFVVGISIYYSSEQLSGWYQRQSNGSFY